MTFEDLVNHYRQTELLADNKTEKTRATYLVYLKNWILPVWGKEYLHSIKAMAVEHWLRNLVGLSNGSKCKTRNIMSGIFSHAIRYEFAEEIPLPRCDSRASARKFRYYLRWRSSIGCSTS